MDRFCLVLTDELAGDDALARERLAEAFDMDAATFQEKVWQRVPLIIRRALDAPAAQAQLARLAALGATGMMYADETALIWLRREGRTLGPLPAASLSQMGREGDLWCHEGESEWRAFRAAGVVLPPPLLAPSAVVSARVRSARPRSSKRLLAWTGVAVLVALALMLWWQRRGPTRADERASRSGGALRAAATATDAFAAPAPDCPTTGVAPTSDEDRYLVTGGERALTGRWQRNGGTYVAEAITHAGTDCADARVQLYLFRDGGFVGPATPHGVDAKGGHFAAFTLVDPEHLTYTADAAASTQSRCERAGNTRPPAATTGATTLVREPQGWTIHMERPGDTFHQPRQAPRYPPDTHGHRHEGTVVIHVEVDKEGFPSMSRRRTSRIRSWIRRPSSPFAVDASIRHSRNRRTGQVFPAHALTPARRARTCASQALPGHAAQLQREGHTVAVRRDCAPMPRHRGAPRSAARHKAPGPDAAHRRACSCRAGSPANRTAVPASRRAAAGPGWPVRSRRRHRCDADSAEASPAPA